MGDKMASDEEIEKTFRSMDTYGNGVVAYTEFLAAMLEGHVNITEDRIADAFERMDVEGNGVISKDDLRLLLGNDFSDDFANEIINQIDANHSGQSKSLNVLVVGSGSCAPRSSSFDTCDSLVRRISVRISKQFIHAGARGKNH